MSAFVDLLDSTVLHSRRNEAFVEDAPYEPNSTCAELGTAVEEQVRGLIRQVFLPGTLTAAHQVAFVPVDDKTDVIGICSAVGQLLGDQISGTVCVVDAGLDKGDEQVTSTEDFKLRHASRRISNNCWQVPRSAFRGESESDFSARWLGGRMEELCLEFDYAVIGAPPAILHNRAVLLGSLCDGIVLVIEAGSTRRVAAQRAKDILMSANVRLLGVVLTERSFPIPKAIYTRI